MSALNYHYKILIERFRAFADNHPQLRRFTHGEISDSDLAKEAEWAWMHVKPITVNYEKGQKVYKFAIFICDLPRVEEDKTGYEAEAINLCLLIMGDFLAVLQLGNLLPKEIELQTPVSAEIFMEEYKHTLTGITADINLAVDWDWNSCDVPVIPT